MLKKLKELSTTLLLVVMILGVSYIGALDHKKNATEEQSQITLQNDLN